MNISSLGYVGLELRYHLKGYFLLTTREKCKISSVVITGVHMVL